jgi:hypothetical protein
VQQNTNKTREDASLGDSLGEVSHPYLYSKDLLGCRASKTKSLICRENFIRQPALLTRAMFSAVRDIITRNSIAKRT